MRSRYKGQCRYCQERYPKGEIISHGPLGWGHAECAEAAAELWRNRDRIESTTKGTASAKASDYRLKAKPRGMR